MRPSSSQFTLDINQARNQLLALHNKARAEHNVAALTLDDTLNQGAQDWADNVAKLNLGSLHSGVKGIGQNTAARKPIDDNCVAALFNQWYGERLHYKYGPYPNTNTGGGEIGHYTQLMDQKSTTCGFGIAWNETSGWVHLVGYYNPPGNVVGKYPWTEK